MELSLQGVTVRQAAAHFGIPRTTLCAFMKKRGIKAPSARTLQKPSPPGMKNISVSGGKIKNDQSAMEDYPFLGLSHFMDDMSGMDSEMNMNE